MSFLNPRRLVAALLCLSVLGAASAQTKAKTANYDPETFNSATDTPLLRSGSSGAAVARAQILFAPAVRDRLPFGPAKCRQLGRKSHWRPVLAQVEVRLRTPDRGAPAH